MKFLPFFILTLFFLTNSCDTKPELTPLTDDPVWTCLNEQDSSFANVLLDLDSELRKINYIGEFEDYGTLYKDAVGGSFEPAIKQLNYNGERDISITEFQANCKLISRCINKFYPENLEKDGVCGIPGIISDETQEVDGRPVNIIKMKPDGKKHRVSTLYFTTVMLIDKGLISIAD
jgi:hypothetical protein